MTRRMQNGIFDHKAERFTAGETIKLSAVCFVLVLVALPMMATDGSRLQLASDAWPPFTDEPENQRVAVELVHTALERAGIDATTTVVDWKEVERGLRKATYDGSAAIWRNEPRERDLLFSQPYLENRLVLIGRKGSEVSAARISDLAGKRVAAVGRYAYGEQISKADGVFFVNGRNDQDNLTKLLAGDVEYMLVDELVARYLVAYQPEEAAMKIEIGSKVLARRMLHFAIRKEIPGAEEIVAAFNREIQKMLADGTYAEILQVGWIRVDVDGDGLLELVALGDRVGERPPGTVYDVFGEIPDETPIEKQRIFVKGSIYKGWDAIPDAYKGPTSQMDLSYKRGTTLGTLQF
ncbi:MAG: transporter substrate-binding domain-containing protein [Acidobacteriota bacterium]